MKKNTSIIAIALLATMSSLGSSAQTQPGGNIQPGMPQAVSPPGPSAPAVVNSGGGVGSVATDTTSLPSGARQANTLRQISEKKAELELLRIQGDIDKMRKPQEEATKKQESMDLQKELDAARKDQAKPISVSAEESGPTVSLLATFGSPGQPSASYAELKVGDLLVHAKVGDRLPSGHYVKEINFDHIEVSKVQKATASKRNKVIYITASDTASVYGSRGRSGETLAPTGGGSSASNPTSLPPMPMR